MPSFFGDLVKACTASILPFKADVFVGDFAFPDIVAIAVISSKNRNIMKEQIFPKTTEDSFCYMLDKINESCFNKLLASLSNKPSTETTKGINERCCQRQGSKYFFSFCFAWDSRTFSGALSLYEIELVLVIQTSIATSYLN